VTITVCMTVLLLHAKANSHFGETRDVISRLIRMILQTGLLTSLLALLVMPLQFSDLVGLYGIPWYILGKSYVISVLANLNARKRSNTSVVHGSGFNQATPSTKLSTMAFSPQTRPGEGRNIDSVDVAFPVHSLIHTNSQSRSVIENAGIPGESLQGEAKSSHRSHYNSI